MSDLADLSGKTILITGINGFLGSNSAAAASGIGARVFGVDLPGTGVRGRKLLVSLGTEEIPRRELDLSDKKAWLTILREIRPDIILHLAGSTRRGKAPADWAASVEGNFLTTSVMVQAVVSLCEQHRPVVVYPGSQMEYGSAPMPWTEETLCKPYGPYGASKLASTDLLLCAERAGMLKLCVARFPILYGPAQSPTMFIPELISRALAGVDFKMTQGRQKRRFVYVTEAAELLLGLAAGLLKAEKIPPLLNMPASQPTSMREIAETIVEQIGSGITLEIGALARREHEVVESWPTDSVAKELGFACNVTLADGLNRTIQWYASNRWFLEEASA